VLDEAHKGDSQESKRQIIFSILSQKGFLFNFSATFTEAIDIVSTVYNLNLSEFINRGFGKQIYVSQAEVKAFKEKADFNEIEKKKIILKNLINLVAVKKAYNNLKQKNLYHNPLLIFLMNSVNTKDADLKLVFKNLANIGRSINESLLEESKKELLKELTQAKYTIGNQNCTLEFVKIFLEGIKKTDIYRYVYNSQTSGTIEYITNPDNKQEIILKLDTSDKPFALIKIGDVSKWIKENLTEYKENQTFEDKGYFETLNNIDSPINILLGSRAFYEGWDSNRPNIITFINIGTGMDAKKFILQAIGRGVRIEPLPNQRKRLDKLVISNQDINRILKRYKREAETLETLFVYATNKKTIETILKELEFVKVSEKFEKGSFEKQKKEIINQKKPSKFRMSKHNLELLRLYFTMLPPERFLLEYEVDYKTYKYLKNLIDNKNKFIVVDESRNYKDITMLIKSLITYAN